MTLSAETELRDRIKFILAAELKLWRKGSADQQAVDQAVTKVMDACRNEGRETASANAIGAAELAVGQFVYRRIEKLIDAKGGTAEGAELSYLADIASSVEEYAALGDEDGSPSPQFAEAAEGFATVKAKRVRKSKAASLLQGEGSK